LKDKKKGSTEEMIGQKSTRQTALLKGVFDDVLRKTDVKQQRGVVDVAVINQAPPAKHMLRFVPSQFYADGGSSKG